MPDITMCTNEDCPLSYSCWRAISALEAIVDPIGHMRKQLKEDERLDGMYAIRIAERPEFYQEIAKKALEEIANCT